MTYKDAEWIKNLRINDGKFWCSWRRIAEVACEERPHLVEKLGWHVEHSGNQLLGKELCEAAAKKMGFKTCDFELGDVEDETA